MRIEQLEYFLQVANYGSLSLTAKKINVGQPTLSAAIAGLEKEVGRPLFRRTRRGMDLTAFGREILPLVEKTVDDYYDIRKKPASPRHKISTSISRPQISPAAS